MTTTIGVDDAQNSEEQPDRVRLLLVCHYYPPHVGGIERAVETQAHQLAGAGYDVTVLTTECGAQPGREVLSPELQIDRVPAWNPIEDRTRIPFPLIGMRAVVQMVRQVRRADIVHVHDLLYVTTWLAVLLAVLLRRRIVMTQHIHMIDHPQRVVVLVQALVYRVIGRLIIPQVERILYLNATVAEFLQGLGARPDRLTFVPNIVDTTSFRPAADTAERMALRRRHGLPTDGVLALFVGRLVPKKGFEKVVAAAEPGWVTVMVGGDAPAAVHQGPGPVHWLGSRGPTEISELYRACDVFVLPSVSEGFPLTVQEAMASGLAVVTTDDPGYDLYALDRSRLHLITPQTQEIAASLRRIATDPGLRTAMGTYSRAYAESEFSVQNYLTALRAVYRAPVSSRGHH